MIEGLNRRSSRLAIVAAAGLFTAGLAMTPAEAADLGGDCCADLEERVAELEATTVRKGNRKVSLKLSGQINQAVLWWDDGVLDDAYIGDNAVSGSRLKFGGSAKINSDWEAGFYLELDYRQSKTESSSQLTSDGGSLNTGGGTDASDIMWYLKSKTLGRLIVGKYDGASDNIQALSLGGVSAVADGGFNDWSEGFFLRSTATGLITSTWGSIYSGEVGDGNEAQNVRYDSPTFAGFNVAASWGEDDHWNVALRYAAEWAALGGLRIASAIGFGEDTTGTLNREEVVGAISLLHVPTGLFGTFAFGMDDDPVPSADESAYYVQGGFNKKFNSLGATRIFGEYYRSEDKSITLDTSAPGVAAVLVAATSGIEGWGVGLVQVIDNAAMELYVAYRHYEVDQLVVGGTDISSTFEDLDVVMTGARIKF